MKTNSGSYQLSGGGHPPIAWRKKWIMSTKGNVCLNPTEVYQITIQHLY